MLIDQYNQAIDELIAKVRHSQRDAILSTAELITQSVLGGGAVHIYDTGHIIDSELIERGGGLMLLKPLKYQLNVQNPVRERSDTRTDRNLEGLAEYALKVSKVMPGDVLIIGSVSGKSLSVIDLACEAKKIKVSLVALTSVSYSSQVQSEHSCGKRLFELVDIVLDNCAPAGEAIMDVEGLGAKLGAASGLSATLIMWSVSVAVVEKLLSHGVQPSVFKSHNYPGGAEYNQMLRKRYAEKGY